MNAAERDVLVKSFRSGFGGDVVTPDDPGYDARRAVWNGTVDARPVVIAGCRTVDDIVAAVNVSRTGGVFPAVRGGGHSLPGLCVRGDVVIDLSGMRSVVVDPARSCATVQPGATWADFDAATAAHGLGSTGGLVSTTGVAGLTLGGGIGWLQRKHGLACDNLVAADVVLASGDVVHTSETEHPALLWGLRGGGGNLGIVASFEFALHPVSTVLGGLMLFGWDRARKALQRFRDWATDLPDEGSMLAAVMTGPPEPFVPPELVGQKVIAVVGCWCGDLDQGAGALRWMRELGPAVDLFGPMPYPALQGMLDAGAPHGLRNYFRSGYASGLGDDMIDVLLEHGTRLPSPMSAVHVHQMGGAVSRVRDGETAFGNREAAFTYNLVSTWVNPVEDRTHIEANQAFASALAPFSTGGVYVNFLGDEGAARVRASYGDATYARLSGLKAEYDPTNLFRRNQNVRPQS